MTTFAPKFPIVVDGRRYVVIRGITHELGDKEGAQKLADALGVSEKEALTLIFQEELGRLVTHHG